jgi:hypothetical protein
MNEQKETTTIIPATPGFYELTLHEDEEEQIWFLRSPIIAWSVTRKCIRNDVIFHQEPVSVSDNIGGALNMAIKAPDGSVCDYILGGEWDSEEAWKAAQTAEYQKRSAKKPRAPLSLSKQPTPAAKASA